MHLVNGAALLSSLNGANGNELVAQPSVAISEAPKVIALVIRLSKETGDAEVMQVADVDAAFDAFKSALLLWHAMNGTALLQPQQPLHTNAGSATSLA